MSIKEKSIFVCLLQGVDVIHVKVDSLFLPPYDWLVAFNCLAVSFRSKHKKVDIKFNIHTIPCRK